MISIFLTTPSLFDDILNFYNLESIIIDEIRFKCETNELQTQWVPGSKSFLSHGIRIDKYVAYDVQFGF